MLAPLSSCHVGSVRSGDAASVIWSYPSQKDPVQNGSFLLTVSSNNRLSQIGYTFRVQRDAQARVTARVRNVTPTSRRKTAFPPFFFLFNSVLSIVLGTIEERDSNTFLICHRQLSITLEVIRKRCVCVSSSRLTNVRMHVMHVRK